MALEPMTTPERIPQFFEKQQAGRAFQFQRKLTRREYRMDRRKFLWLGNRGRVNKNFSKIMALFVQFEVFRRNPQLTQNKIYKFHSISWGFQLYKLTSFNWNWTYRYVQPRVVSIVQTYILQLKLFTCWLLEKKRFNCANLHPWTETVSKSHNWFFHLESNSKLKDPNLRTAKLVF